MLVESQKLHLIEELLKIEDAALLSELETIINRAGREPQKKPSSAHKYLGKWSKEYAEQIEKVIEEGCEQINEDDWK